MGLAKYASKRIITGLITFFFVVVVNFFIFWIMPGDPVAIYVYGNPTWTPEQIQEIIRILGLDKPWFMLFLSYLVNVFTFNYGVSFQNFRPVSTMLLEALPYTILLLVPATIGSVVLGMKLGVRSAWNYGKKSDLSTLITSLVFYSMPVFWLGMFMILIFGFYLRLFPIAGVMSSFWLWTDPLSNPLLFVADIVWHLFLPMMTLILFLFGGYYLIMRNTMLDTLTQDYIVTAKAKGASDNAVMYKHAQKNAMLPMITVIVLAFATIFSGAVLTETIFSWPGMGRLMYNAAVQQDYPVLWGTFSLLAMLVVFANILADILYGILDPRIRY
ncbi:MAG: ABC transporter permease [Candidatus Hodarchaeota archaeon]